MNLPKIFNCLVEPYYPYSWPYLVTPYPPYQTWIDDHTWIGDFPPLEDKKRKDDLQKGWTKNLEKLQKPKTLDSLEILKNQKTNFVYNPDGSVSFKLEVVGYGQEHISAEIKDSTLHVSGKRGQKSFSQQYQIPSPEKLDLNNVSAKVEHGLLEIIFSAKRTEVKSIKVL